MRRRFVPSSWITAIRAWTWHIGRDPRRVSAPAVILFPLQPSQLSCGLAGILAIKRDRPAQRASDLLSTVLRCGDTLSLAGLARLAAEGKPLDAYLGGGICLDNLDTAVQALKDNDPFIHLLLDPEARTAMRAQRDRLAAFLAGELDAYAAQATRFSTAEGEIINGRLTRLKDIVWSLDRDVLDNTDRVRDLAGGASAVLSPEAAAKFKQINYLLNCIDRLEVRGRDSAGIEIRCAFPDRPSYAEAMARMERAGMAEDLKRRSAAGDLMNGSVCIREGDRPCVAFTYKTFSVIGTLGRNVADLRRRIREDRLFQAFSRFNTAVDAFVAHTRWASVGSITEENCHPVNNFTVNGSSAAPCPHYGAGGHLDVALNGDIDNYDALRATCEADGIGIALAVTTDTKIIPLTVERHLRQGATLEEAFRRAVSAFEGSHAIALTSDLEPGKILLALRGSGQTIYVGATPDAYLFSSELYGLVEGTPAFIKMDGEKSPDPGDPEKNGQIFVLEASATGLTGIRACYYDGTPLPLEENAVQKAAMTTRDIDRRDYPHFFLKEISESSSSVQKTLRGKYRIDSGAVRFNLGEDILPERVRKALDDGDIRRILLIGHGTAAVAGTAVADGMQRYLKGRPIRVEAVVASELSGFAMDEDLRDALVIPITQSGTTTDTNRAVAMAGDRGASIIAIVNRRQSDITTKSHGVFYTSDGRDIEMSVASTKAFYSQIVAGHILGLTLAQQLGTMRDEAIIDELRALESAPSLMDRILAGRDRIRDSVARLAKTKRYWAIVGSGPNRAAADEIRIKLSELCYKTISSDVTENKKHIDLSAEPLILVAAAGNPDSVVGDIAKDVAIFKAHKAGTVVFADEGDARFDGTADAVIPIPRGPQPLPVILNTVAGHLWGYYAACCIDEDAQFLREFRARLSLAVIGDSGKPVSYYEKIGDRGFRHLLREFTRSVNLRRGQGAFSFADTNTLSDMLLLLKYAAGKMPLEDFREDFPAAGGATPVDALDICLGRAIDELSRPIDAIRHQAKTVTVGTSRKEQLLEGPLFAALQALEIPIRRLAGKSILTLTRIQPAIAEVTGFTVYDVGGLDTDGNPTDASTITIVRRGGVSLAMPSRTENVRQLMGTKKTLVSTGHVYAGRGKSDGAPIVAVPILGDRSMVSRIALFHVSYGELTDPAARIAVLGYKFNDIRNMINELNLPWSDRYLEGFSMSSLLSDPVETLVGKIKANLDKTNATSPA